MNKTCPECGKEYIQVSTYDKEKTKLYIHKKELIQIGRLPGYYRITESCYVKDENK